MAYNIIKPPFTLDFYEMPKKELKEYFRWFQEVIPDRINGLARTVKESPGFENWQPDYTPISLISLGEWMSTQVQTRERSEEELEQKRQEIGHAAHPVEIPKWELTNQTFSLAMDIGMYLSQVFLRNHPSLKWDQLFSSKRDMDYGQPVLVGFGRAPFNPVQMTVTQAYALVHKTRSGKGLRELYDIWSRKIH